MELIWILQLVKMTFVKMTMRMIKTVTLTWIMVLERNLLVRKNKMN